MVLLRFTKLIDKVLDKSKTQTIRLPRKIVRKDKIPPIIEGTQLDVYILMKVGHAKVKSICRKKLKDLTLEDALKDGFNSIDECISAIQSMHKCSLETEFDIIQYEPYWEGKKIVSIQEVN